MDKVLAVLSSPSRLYNAILHRISFLFSKETFLKILFKKDMGRELDLENPQTYSEKIQWLKLYNRKQCYVNFVDKYEVKKIVASLIGEEYIIPTIGIYNKFSEINFNELPEQFVIKSTNGGGNTGVVICKDKKNFNVKAARRKINSSLNDLSDSGEWPYKRMPKRIIVEQYMEDTTYHELRDYKFFCFDGVVKALFVATDRSKGEELKFDFFDENFVHLPFVQGHPNSKTAIEKPVNFELMKSIAEKISAGEPHLRVDLYEINGKVYFGEITLFHFSGLEPFVPIEWDYKFGSWIKLPNKITK